MGTTLTFHEYLNSSYGGEFHAYPLLNSFRQLAQSMSNSSCMGTCSSVSSTINDTPSSSIPSYVYGAIPVNSSTLFAASPELYNALLDHDYLGVAQLHLIVATENVTATMHYDAKDLFILQLSGKYTVHCCRSLLTCL